MTEIKVENKTSIGIALSGGAAKGYSHIGILKALKEFGIEPDIISGTSMGALIGVLYAEGYTTETISQWVHEHPFTNSIKFAWNKNGLFKLEKIKELLHERIPHNSFRKLKKPFYVAVSNLSKGREEIMNTGNLDDAVLASCSIPVVFEPYVIKKDIYADGGLFNNLPTKVLKNKCQILIGSNVNHIAETDSYNGLWEIANRTFSLSVEQNSGKSKRLCDLLIEPPELASYSLWDFKEIDAFIEIGYKHTKEVLQQDFAADLLSLKKG